MKSKHSWLVASCSLQRPAQPAQGIQSRNTNETTDLCNFSWLLHGAPKQWFRAFTTLALLENFHSTHTTHISATKNSRNSSRKTAQSCSWYCTHKQSRSHAGTSRNFRTHLGRHKYVSNLAFFTEHGQMTDDINWRDVSSNHAKPGNK